MRLFSTCTLLFLLLTVGLGGCPAHAQDAAPRAEALLDRLEAVYRSGQVLSADVTQTVRSPYDEGPQRFSGRLTAQGVRYRVEAPRQTVVTDGETVWVYNAAREQVLVSTPAQDEGSLTPTDLLRVKDTYEATLVETTERGGVAHHVLRLEPQAAGAPFESIMLWLRAEDHLVTRAEATDVNGSVITIELSNLRLEEAAAPGTFRFEAPPGVEVVDLRS